VTVHPTRPLILVVDDDGAIRTSLGAMLEDEGYETALASDGRAALGLLRGGLRPTAILLDLMMPVMDGWDFRADQLRDPTLSDIPVIVLSAAGFSQQTIRDQLAGADFVRKPPHVAEILDALARPRGTS
jgi:CheY-like chemotaxis protein